MQIAYWYSQKLTKAVPEDGDKHTCTNINNTWKTAQTKHVQSTTNIYISNVTWRFSRYNAITEVGQCRSTRLVHTQFANKPAATAS